MIWESKKIFILSSHWFSFSSFVWTEETQLDDIYPVVASVDLPITIQKKNRSTVIMVHHHRHHHHHNGAATALLLQQRSQQMQQQAQQQLTLAPNQSVLFESRYEYPTMDFSTDGVSHLALTQYTSVRIQDIEQLLSELNVILKQHNESCKSYDTITITLFVIAILLALPTFGLSVILLIGIAMIPAMKQQKLMSNLEQVIKPQVRSLIQRANERVLQGGESGTEWVVSYVPYLQINAMAMNGASRLSSGMAVVLRLIRTIPQQQQIMPQQQQMMMQQQVYGQEQVPNMPPMMAQPGVNPQYYTSEQVPPVTMGYQSTNDEMK